jgi:outer membrane receptor protein involved in Fe transport
VQFDTGFWPSDTRVSIRGLFARAGRPSAAVLIDGIDAVSESLESSGGSALLNQRVLDIERIEVARGPQSALYGRGAFAGAINYVTRRPQYDWNGSLLADVAEDSRYELQATFGGPIIKDKLAFNALVSGFEYDGPYTNPNTGGGLGASDSKGAGLSFEWKPTDNFTAYWNTTYSDQEDGPVPIVLIKPNAFRVLQNDGLGNTTLIPNADYADRPTLCDSASSGPTGDACLLVVTGTIKADETQLDTEPDPRFETPTDYPGTDDETLRSNLILDWDLSDSVRLRSATSFTDSDQSLAQDTNHVSGPNGPDSLPDINGEVGALNGTASDTINDFSFEQFYQEFQLSGQSGESVNWLVGVNGFFESASTQSMSRFWYRPIDGAFNDQCDFFPAAPCTFFDAEPFDKLIERDTSSVSLFGLIGWNLTDDLKMTLEGRLIHDRIEVSTNTSDTAQAGLNGPDYSYPMTPGFADEVSDKNFVPRASLEYTLSDDALVYVSAAKGIKPPTYNTNDFNEPEKARVKKETLWTYEIGAKTQWNDGRITVNGAIFYNDYKDQQTRIQFPSAKRRRQRR